MKACNFPDCSKPVTFEAVDHNAPGGVMRLCELHAWMLEKMSDWPRLIPNLLHTRPEGEDDATKDRKV